MTVLTNPEVWKEFDRLIESAKEHSIHALEIAEQNKSRTAEVIERIGRQMDEAVASMKNDPWQETVTRNPTEADFDALLETLWSGK